MNNPMKIIAIVGTYRKGGIIDKATDEILASAQKEGAETEKIYLLDRHIEFCTNCRQCTQTEGPTRGECPINDEMSGILDSIERSGAVVLASPMNFWTVTALMKRFIERLVCYAYWPWGKHGPVMRNKLKEKRAVLVFSSAAPSILVRLLTRIAGLLKTTAAVLGAKTIGVLSIGLCAEKPDQELSQRTKTKARKLGKKLAGKKY
jgi:multimeric flavodoxin WrbA